MTDRGTTPHPATPERDTICHLSFVICHSNEPKASWRASSQQRFPFAPATLHHEAIRNRGYAAFVPVQHIDQKIDRHHADLERVLFHARETFTAFIERMKCDADIGRDPVTSPSQTSQNFW